jgi:hypothetical protein
MQNMPITLVLAAALTVYLTLDTAVILQTGKTPVCFTNFFSTARGMARSPAKAAHDAIGLTYLET